MKQMIEIAALPNGVHRNQTCHGAVPAGWAVIPEGMELPNFPFGKVTAEEIDGVMTVTAWEPGIVPEPQPAPDPGPTETEQLRADVDYIAAMTGVTL